MVPIYQAAGIRSWDNFTMENEPVSSTELMQRAAGKLAEWLLAYTAASKFSILAGNGNNGGDGLVLAQLLKQAGKEVELLRIFPATTRHSHDFEYHWNLLDESLQTKGIPDPEDYNPAPDVIIIDAIYGTGLRLPLKPLVLQWIEKVNSLPNQVVSLDIPSGMLADGIPSMEATIKADVTLTIQVPKPCFFFPETGDNIGVWHIVPIGLHPGFPEQPWAYLLGKYDLKTLPRARFAHKGTMGHALLMGGEQGKAGAIVLAAEAAVHSGCGLVSVLAPSSALIPLQSNVPQAMMLPGSNAQTLVPDDFPEKDIYKAIGIGPGMGTGKESVQLLQQLLKKSKASLVIDADALNILSNRKMEKGKALKIPAGSILTPHPLEFDRFFGKRLNGNERIERARKWAREDNIILVLKGAYTCIIDDEGEVTFNMSGNAGMAKGGSGDILTGLITGLLARGYAPKDAALLGVYLHGRAGDLAAAELGQEFMSSREIIRFLAPAFKELENG